jgi:preprotein translocase subunit SecD
MMICGNRFNIYLAAGLALVLACGCQTEEGKKKHQESTLRLHLEALPDTTAHTESVSVLRDHPVPITIEKSPFLTEAQVAESKVVEGTGGFAISVKFNRQGGWLLEQYTAANHGRRIAIFSTFCADPEKKLNEGRWLAAPIINHRIADATLTFTPDATREEADAIALGLHNVARKMDNIEDTKW